MPQVSILIRYLALLRHSDTGLTVLFPSAGHDLFLEHSAIGALPVTEGGDIVLLLNGERYFAPVHPANAAKVARLEDVAEVSTVGIRPEILAAGAHADLNGRLLLGGGKIIDREPFAAPHLKGREWKITPNYRPVLTDTLEYLANLPEGGTWELLVPGIGTIDLTQGGQVIVENRDRPFEDPEPQAPGAPLALEEFRVVYDLTNEPNRTAWPVPVLDEPPPAPNHRVRAFARGPSRPLCSPTQSHA